MVKKLQKYVVKIKKFATSCRKTLKKEILSWRSLSFNILIKVLIFLVSKNQSHRVTSSTNHSLPTSASFLEFLRVILYLSIYKSIPFCSRLKINWWWQSRRHGADGCWPHSCCWQCSWWRQSPCSSPGWCPSQVRTGIWCFWMLALFTLQYILTSKIKQARVASESKSKNSLIFSTK